MSRPKQKTIADLEAERDKLNKRIAAARKAEKQAQDAEIIAAVDEWVTTYPQPMSRDEIPGYFRKWAKKNRAKYSGSDKEE